MGRTTRRSDSNVDSNRRRSSRTARHRGGRPSEVRNVDGRRRTRCPQLTSEGSCTVAAALDVMDGPRRADAPRECLVGEYSKSSLGIAEVVAEDPAAASERIFVQLTSLLVFT